MTREKILIEIENLMKTIGQTDFDNENYKKYQDELKAWQDILAAYDAVEKAVRDEEKADKKEKKARRMDLIKAVLDFLKTVTAVGGTLAGICVIVCAEEAVPKILTSKSMSFVTKMLPKVV